MRSSIKNHFSERFFDRTYIICISKLLLTMGEVTGLTHVARSIVVKVSATLSLVPWVQRLWVLSTLLAIAIVACACRGLGDLGSGHRHDWHG